MCVGARHVTRLGAQPLAISRAEVAIPPRARSAASTSGNRKASGSGVGVAGALGWSG